LKPVMVIGGGVAGIQAALDLADRGLRVHLVEKDASIGGVMAQLDKTLPTMDCSICILAPKMIECYRHPNITIHTLSRVKEVGGGAGDFHVKVLKEPRSVDEAKCTGCGICSQKCPTRVRDDWQEGLATRKAIYIMFPQAVPLTAAIDRDSCLYFQKGICQVCSSVCPAGAIDYTQEAETLDLNVSSIIVATGFQEYDPTELKEYGYGRFKDVLTAMEFERLVCASGPTGGHLNRPSDGRLAHRLAFVQCVGSRSQNKGYPFCSSVCCMYATKEAVLVKEHDPGSEVSIFYIDLKVFGKGFQRFVDRAKTQYGVNYVRGRPGEIRLNPLTGNLTVWYENTLTGDVSSVEVDLVVLCTAMVARPENHGLAQALGLELDEWGFFKPLNPLTNPVETGMSGVFLCGCSHGPRDIPESVAEASAAAACAAETARRFT
jgi:heterodisulfide reductase subunit A